MHPRTPMPHIIDVQVQVARLYEVQEHLLDAMDSVAQLPNSVEVEMELANIAGSLLCICDSFTTLLERMHSMDASSHQVR